MSERKFLIPFNLILRSFNNNTIQWSLEICEDQSNFGRTNQFCPTELYTSVRVFRVPESNGVYSVIKLGPCIRRDRNHYAYGDKNILVILFISVSFWDQPGYIQLL